MAQVNFLGMHRTCQRTTSVLQVHKKGPISSFPIIPSKITTLLTAYPRGTIITSFSDAIKTIFHARLHVFSRPFHAQTFVPRCHRRSFDHTFGQSHSRLGVAFVQIFLKILLLVSRGILYVHFFSIDSYIALTLILNPL